MGRSRPTDVWVTGVTGAPACSSGPWVCLPACWLVLTFSYKYRMHLCVCFPWFRAVGGRLGWWGVFAV